MTEDKKKRSALKSQGRNYSVGYGKPPDHSRFKKGQSGNPKGRPKGAKGKPPNHDRLAEIVLREAYREIPVRDGEREVRVSMAQAAVRALFVKGARGTARSAEAALELLAAIESRQRKEHDAFLEAVISYKTEWESEIAARKRRGEPEPELDIHPAQIELNVATGEVRVTGPLTKEDRERQKVLQERRSEFQAEIDRLQRKLKRTRKPEVAEMIRKDIAGYEQKLNIIRSVIPDRDRVDAFRRRIETDFRTEE